MSNSDFEVKLYECVYNGGLGKSHLLKKKKDKYGYDLFLFYVEENNYHFIMCDAIYGTKECCSFSRTQYYSSIDNALKAYNEA